MLAEWVLRNHRELRLVEDMGLGLGQAPEERLAVLSSTVSSRMLEAIARKEGIRWVETLTGECLWCSLAAAALARPAAKCAFSGALLGAAPSRLRVHARRRVGRHIVVDAIHARGSARNHVCSAASPAPSHSMWSALPSQGSSGWATRR